MIMNCGNIFVQWRHPTRTLCCAASPSTNSNNEQLREQLDHLHKEAEVTRAKANSARMRLMRLSEAAEKLRRQAAVSVQIGKEKDARELLFQKKKVMQAMEKSKSRIELLDELAAKLYEAISVKETQLIGNVAIELETGQEDPSPVRIVSPNQGDPKNLIENQDDDPDSPNDVDMQKLQLAANDQADLQVDDRQMNGKMQNEVDILQSLNDISSYEDFLKHLDQQLNKIEAELAMFLKYSTLILGNMEEPENCKVQHALEILNSVRHIRGRIASITETKVEIR